MRLLLILSCLSAQVTHAQIGFNKGYDYGYYFNYFNDLAVQNDTIIAYGLAQDTLWPYQQGVLVSRFDTLGNALDNVIILDTANNVYSIDKHWGKIIATSDGGYAMTTAVLYGGDGVFIKLDRKLELEFAQRYRDTVNLSEFLVAPVEIPEGYLLYGYYQRAGNGKHDALLRKVDKQGNMIWRKNFGVYNRYEAFYTVEPWGDSLLVFSGRDVFDVFQPNYARPWVSIFNYQGELQWDWTSITNAPYEEIIMGWFYPQIDSSWLAYGGKYIGTNPQYGWERYQSYWVKLDKDFQFQWAKPFGPNIGYLGRFIKVLQASNGDIIGVGERGPYELNPETYYRKGWVLRFSPEADSIWEWTGKIPVPNAGAHFLSGGALLSSGSIVAAGKGEDANGHGLCWLVKLSPDGCVDTLFCHATSAVEAPTLEDAGIQVYPNPARDNVEIRVAGAQIPGHARIRLIDLQGRLVREYKLSDLDSPLPLVGIPGGVYFIQLISGQGGVVGWKKLVVVP